MKKLITILSFLITLFITSGTSAQEQTAETYRRLYAVSAPYLTITDDISFSSLKCFWDGSCPILDDGADGISNMLVSEEELPSLISIFGSEPVKRHIRVLPKSDLYTDDNLSEAWMIIPFEDIEPRRKIITIDEADILFNQFDPDTWPLTAVIGDITEDTDITTLPISNRDASKLTNVVLTGVTAMVRGTAAYMDLDPLYPASQIREPLIAADILHINNEVPFAEKCDITTHYAGLVFCSRPSYMALLDDIGTDIIELDGDHFQDHGEDPVLLTLDMYDEAGIPYYGGGHNKQEAQQPVLISHNGNHFAFLGCNAKEIGYATASDTRPGAVHCDIDLMTQQIRELSKQGIIPIVTFQHLEVFQVKPIDQVRADFEAVRDAGAVIVSGSQSHIPMEFDVSSVNFVHYGLGNLFFDQAFFLPETAEAFIDRHIFYNGRYINTELLTIRFTNNALSQYMDPGDRAQLLERIFKISEVAGLSK
ncbi:MAG: CapA family protein [Anaerolineaceae bacterium]|nr:CapA family protein [Anaerolineaceae bacterium]